MVKWLTVLVSVGMVCLSAGASQASQTQEKPANYGLSQTQVDGVTITRGKAYRPARDFPSNAEREKKTVNLSRNFRGTVFGKHKIVRGGQVFYREQLLPIRQRDDE